MPRHNPFSPDGPHERISQPATTLGESRIASLASAMASSRMIGRQPEPGPGGPGVGVGWPLGGGGVDASAACSSEKRSLTIDPAGGPADQQPAILHVQHLEHFAGIESVDGQRSGQDLRLVLNHRDAIADFVSGGRARADHTPSASQTRPSDREMLRSMRFAFCRPGILSFSAGPRASPSLFWGRNHRRSGLFWVNGEMGGFRQMGGELATRS